MTMDGVRLAARFSLPTNRLRYCGPTEGPPILERAISEGEGLAEARSVIERFESVTPYLNAIARRDGRDPFDARVVEAYWIGNELLEGFTRAEFRGILDTLQRRGMPRGIAARLAAGLPETPIPHHAFHVTYVGVGVVTGHVPTTLDNMDRCRPSWGRVVRVKGRLAQALRPTLELRDGVLGWGPPERLYFEVDPRFLPGLQVDDWVAFHWRWPVVILEPRQLAKLREFTARAFQAASATSTVLTAS